VELRGPRTLLRPLRAEDEAAWLEAVAASRDLHQPWSTPAATPEAFRRRLDQVGERLQSFLLVDIQSGRPAAGFTFSEIVRGCFQSAYLGYSALLPFAGTGRTSEGLELALRCGFEQLDLHRIEANIQPGNGASIRMVKRAGFELEGLSKGYLRIDGQWRDHERWAIREEIWAAR
jgi:ribosomal-protein-alanine N-acetyltransferase